MRSLLPSGLCVKQKGPGVITTSGSSRLRVHDAKTAIEITNVYNPKFRQLLFALPYRNHIRNADKYANISIYTLMLC